MSFITSLVFGIISVCLGGILGCAVCVSAGICFHKRYLKSHFTIICILLSIAVAFAAFGFIFIKDLNHQMQFLPSYWIFFASLFLTGLLSTSFWKIVLPLVIFSYIVICTITGVKLYRHFGQQLDSVPVVVNFDSVKCGDQTYFVDSIKNKSIVVEVYTIPGTLIMPLPRVWYSIIGVVSSDVQFEAGQNLRLLSDFSGQPVMESEEKKTGFLWQKQIEQYFGWILKNKKNLLVSVPENELMPVLYDLNIKTDSENLACCLDRKL